jgi:APA family basic amino acid/polyamine antiporter
MGASTSDDRHPRDRLKRALSLQDATFLVVASVVGSGIFLTPGTIAERLPHAGLILAVWVVGGLLSLAGALANAELGAMYPRAGGDYVYLREAFHPMAGFLVGWLSFFAIFAGTIATLATGFAAGLGAFFDLDTPAVLGIAVSTIIATSALNHLGVRWGALANNITGYAKVVALLGLGVVAPLTGKGSVENLRPLVDGIASAAPPLAFALALSPVLFSFLGWNASIYVASELRKPGRNLPLSLFIGLTICTAVYLVVNLVYLYALPVANLGEVENAGEAAARVLFGALGGSLVAAFVLASILGTLNANVLLGPRIAYAMALDHLFFGGVDRVHASYQTPAVAIWVQAGVAIALVLALRTFPNALDYTIFAILLATIADTAALYALRRRQPDRPRPYRAWGYPWVPALYIAANLLIASSLLWFRPRQSLIGLAVLLAGLPFYALFAARRRRRP